MQLSLGPPHRTETGQRRRLPDSYPKVVWSTPSAPPSTKVVRPPPGFEFGQESSAPPQQTNINHESHERSTNVSGPLIDFSDDGSDLIVEKLAVSSPLANQKRYTMRQKAKKRVNKNRVNALKAEAARAQLEKPDPLPGPAPKSTPAENSAVFMAAFDSPVNQQNNAGPSAGGTAATPPSIIPGKIAQFLNELRFSGSLVADEIVVSIGLVMITHKGNVDILKGARDTRKIEAKLLAEAKSLQTDFLGRLTTSDVDSEYMLDLFPGNLAMKGMYDIHIKTTEGAPLIIRLDPRIREFQILEFMDLSSPTAYLMYPIHYWDARLMMENEVIDNRLRDECQKLVDSMWTINEAPTIRGLALSHAFSLEGIIAKRIYRKTGEDGICFTVTEKSDLGIEPLSQTDVNFLAVSLPRQEMVDAGRLWFEAGISSRDFSAAGADTLERVTDHIVANLDGVGYANQGTWERRENPKPVQDGSNKDWYLYQTWWSCRGRRGLWHIRR